MSQQMMTQLIAEYFKTQPVLKAWIFGSYARGEQTADSDIDILIQPEKSVGLFKLSGMHLDLQELLNLEVDLVTVKGLSGRTGVAIVTSGPGATNTITGISDAMLDSTPIVVIAGQVGTDALGTDAFQEIDLVGVTQPITKWL